MPASRLIDTPRGKTQPDIADRSDAYRQGWASYPLGASNDCPYKGNGQGETYSRERQDWIAGYFAHRLFHKFGVRPEEGEGRP